MAETLETATTTDLTLDYDVPIEFELESGVLIDVIIDFIVEPDFAFSTFFLGGEDGDWACEVEVEVRTVPYPSPDAEMPVVSDPA